MPPPIKSYTIQQINYITNGPIPDGLETDKPEGQKYTNNSLDDWNKNLNVKLVPVTVPIPNTAECQFQSVAYVYNWNRPPIETVHTQQLRNLCGEEMKKMSIDDVVEAAYEYLDVSETWMPKDFHLKTPAEKQILLSENVRRPGDVFWGSQWTLACLCKILDLSIFVITPKMATVELYGDIHQEDAKSKKSYALLSLTSEHNYQPLGIAREKTYFRFSDDGSWGTQCLKFLKTATLMAM